MHKVRTDKQKNDLSCIQVIADFFSHISPGLIQVSSCSVINPRDPLQLHQHQENAIRVARGGHSYILTTGTSSGKSLVYIVPIVDYVLRNPHLPGIKAIVVYPMNALANSQLCELGKYLTVGYTGQPVTFKRYTGQENAKERNAIIANLPDILLTNYVMLELILTRLCEQPLLHMLTGASEELCVAVIKQGLLDGYEHPVPGVLPLPFACISSSVKAIPSMQRWNTIHNATSPSNISNMHQVAGTNVFCSLSSSAANVGRNITRCAGSS